MEENKFTDATPDYYNDGEISCIEAMVAAKGLEKTIAFCECCAFKYEWRLGKKDSVGKEVSKIKKYLDLYLELSERLECERLGKKKGEFEIIAREENIIGIFSARESFSVANSTDEVILDIHKDEKIIVEDFATKLGCSGYRCRSINNDIFFLTEEGLRDYCVCWATAREADLKKKGLTQRQINDILNK